MSKAINHSFVTRSAINHRGLCLVVQNNEACAFHSTDRHPSMNACRPIRSCAGIADDREAEVHLGTSLVCHLHKCS